MKQWFSRLLRGSRPVDEHANPAVLARLGEKVAKRLEGDLGLRNRGGNKAQLYVMRDFLAPQQSVELIRLIDSKIGPSTLFNDGGGSVRTSSTHFFAAGHPIVKQLSASIDQVLGLDRSQAETLQGQRYLSGEEYRHHCDFFRVERDHWRRERHRGGQRSWTAMIYLNAVEAGGGTDFPRLGLTITPEPGTLLVWNNMTRSGTPNRATIHGGLPVIAGRKYVVTQWYRQGEWNRSPS